MNGGYTDLLMSGSPSSSFCRQVGVAPGKKFYNNCKYSLSRLWIQSKELHNEGSFPCRRLDTESWNKEHEFSKDPEEVRLVFQNMLP